MKAYSQARKHIAQTMKVRESNVSVITVLRVMIAAAF